MIQVRFIITKLKKCTLIAILHLASCSFDVRWFPFDEQVCFLKFGTGATDKILNWTSRKASNTVAYIRLE